MSLALRLRARHDWVAVAVVVLATACSDATSPALDAGMSSLPDIDGAAPLVRACSSEGSGEVDGVYSVPVPTDLEPFASFSVKNVQLCGDANAVELGYQLPELLVGNSTKVSLRGAYDEAARVYRLSGKDGEADCTRAGTKWSCQERLTGIDVDQAALERQLSDLPADEATHRRDVASIFGQDPIGVLTFLAL